MTDLIFNAAKGKLGFYGELPGDDDKFVMIPLSECPSNNALKDLTTISAVLSGGGVEHESLGRKDVLNVSVVLASDRVKVIADNVLWETTVDGDEPTEAMLLAYDPGTGGGDGSLIPVAKYDFVYEPNGEALTAVVNANGLVSAI